MIWRQPCDEGVALARPACPSPDSARPWILAATILGSSLAFIDGTVVNVALPVLQRELGATAVDVQWVVEAYALLLSALLLVGGSLGDRLGRRRVYATGIVIFSLASAGCGLASTVRQLIVARAVQGVGAALLVPGSLAIIGASFPQRERGRAIGTWASFGAVTMAFGPVTGGWLIEHVSWRWAFFVNLPVAAVVLALLYTRVPETRDPEAAGRVDWPGAMLVTIGLAGVVYALLESPRLGWSNALVAVSFAVGIAALIGFGIHEGRTRFPMVPPGLFRSRTFTGANLLTVFLYGALGCLFFFLPLNLIQVHRYSATAAGAVALPFVVIMSILTRWSGGLVDRFGARLPLVTGPLVAAAGFVLFALPGTSGSYATTFLPAMVVLGVGMAITVPPLTTTVMNAVDPRYVGIASGINNTVSRAAGLLTIALVGLVVLAIFGRELDDRLVAAGLSADIRAALGAERINLGGLEPPPTTSPAEGAAIARAVAEAFVTAFRWMALIAAALAVASAVAAAIMIEGRASGVGVVSGDAPRRRLPAQAPAGA